MIRKKRLCLALLYHTVSYLSEATSRIPALSVELAFLRYLRNRRGNIFLMALCFVFRNREERSRAIWYQICHLSGLVSWSPLDKTFRSPIWETWKCDRILSGWEWGKVDYAFPLHSRKSTSKVLYAGNVVGTPHTVGESIHSPSVVNKHGNVAERQINSGPDIPPQ